MYLKSIEIQGFKSFANKIVFEFHDGITGIVGPNGSGKSNVADAVRWVLGEQSAKQLRGSNMQDVIFSGSEARKPLGYAFVEITFDNSDHKLPIAYDEVSVARRVYRSGESEYLMNGMTCRLRDVQELFMDTGIGKEGYSIIGQGQIDKILSTKPEDRRELFDEAAGIVKFKKRKAIAEKNLEEASDNLARIMDIIGEIEKQIGPLEKQSKVAKEYLLLRDILKKLEINSFIIEYEKSDSQKKQLDEKYEIASDELNSSKAAGENARNEYERIEASLEDYNKAIDEGKSYRSELLIGIEKMEGEIKLFEQQLISITQNSERINERIADILKEIENRKGELEAFKKQKDKHEQEVERLLKLVEEAAGAVGDIRNRIALLTGNIEEANSNILRLADEDGSVKSELQKYNTMLEQVTLRKSELAGKLLRNRSESEDASVKAAELQQELERITGELEKSKKKVGTLLQKIHDASDEEAKLIKEAESKQQAYLGEKSKLESLRDIAEKYEGYGNAVRNIMEHRNRFPGIEGVVADLISVEKKYETAVETALGASVSHIVTTDEATAKTVIEYLKFNKLGRATFLPITSVGRRNVEVDDKIFTKKGVISDAAGLVSCDKKYNGIVSHLLKSFIVVDNIDNALALAKEYEYGLRIVTLEGEQLAPGGSIAGGAFKNSANLLGRKRELAELEESVQLLEKAVHEVHNRQRELAAAKKDLRDELDASRQKVQDLSVEQNSSKLNLDKELQNIESIAARARGYESEAGELEVKALELNDRIQYQNSKLTESFELSGSLKNSIEEWNRNLAELRFGEGEAVEKVNKLKLEAANTEQAGQYTDENINRITGEIARLNADKEDISDTSVNSHKEAEDKKTEIENNRTAIEKNKSKIEELDKHLEELGLKKELLNADHKSFLEAWAEYNRKITELEKEVLRLGNQRDKLAEQLDSQTNYIWEEYQLTYSGALEYRDPEIRSSSIRKDIGDTRSSIKALGDVNVNSIEEFKSVSERYVLLSSQRDDLITSKESIQGIIDELDTEMRRQFASQFELIRKEFNSVFRELFGGGKGELELIEDEDMLEAGIRIIAQPPGKKLQNMMQLSGGEKALTAIALLFAIQNLKPSPFCLLDEIEAALDDSNVKRFASYLKKLTKNSQFIVITHRRGTMNAADILYGITMQEKGVSTLVSVSLIEGDLTQ